jgi:hypothetical protein
MPIKSEFRDDFFYWQLLLVVSVVCNNLNVQLFAIYNGTVLQVL